MASLNKDSPRGEQTVQEHQDSLALVIAQVACAQRIAQQTPVAMTGDTDTSVFLCGFASQDSFVGSIDDEDGMSDEAINCFISQNNPDMFRRLFTNESTAAEGYQVLHNACYADNGFSTMAKEGGMIASNDYVGSGSAPTYQDLQQVLLQLKRLLVSSLLGKYVL